MKVSKKSDYALRALTYLAENPNLNYVSIRKIAEANDIPKRFLEHIMLDLKDKGWVKGLTGREGGYCLAADPKSISLGAVIRHFDGMVAPINCVSVQEFKACSQEVKCRFRRFFLELRNYTANLMDSCNLLTLATMSPVAENEVGQYVYEGGSGI